MIRHLRRIGIGFAAVLIVVGGVRLLAQMVGGQLNGAGPMTYFNVDAGGRLLVNPSIVDGNSLFAVSLARFPLATTTAARGAVGALQTEKSARWTVVSSPAVSVQASASIAAEAAVRHVADCVTFSGGSTAAPALTQLQVNLRDGATGAGTVIASWQLTVLAATGQNVAPFGVCGLNLTGTTNTAMTLEYSALLTNLFESATVTGYNVQ